jgi:phosphoribosylpyrophosphate synthetase
MMFANQTIREELTINYCYEYYPKRDWDKISFAEKENTYLVLNFKNPNNAVGKDRQEKVKTLQEKVKQFISGLSEDVIVAYVPSSTMGKPSPFSDLVEGRELIELQRIETVGKATDGNRDIFVNFVHLNSILVNTDLNLAGKTVFLFDDVVTSGCSLKACSELLIGRGVQDIQYFVLGATTSA